MTIATMLSLGETALKLGLICSLTVLALFLSYSMLNVCDLSTDGCFTFGAAVGAVVAVSGHPFLSIVAAMAAGVLFWFCNCNPADKTRCGQSACRNHRKYGFVFRKYCSYGRLIPDQYEPYNDGIQYDERYTFGNSVKRQRRYHHCGNRCDPRNPVSCIFSENKTWSCNQSNRK